MPRVLRRSLYLLFGVVLALSLAVTQSTALTAVTPNRAQTATQNAQTLLDIGRSAYHNQQTDDAITAWQAAAQGFAQQGEHLQQALAFSYLSLAYQNQGDWSQAEAVLAQSLQQLDQWRANASASASAQSQTIQGQVLNTQGALQFSKGALTDALGSWQQSGSFYQQAGDTRRYTGSLINQARTLQALGYFLQARDALAQAQMQLEQVDPALRIIGLQSLGDTLRGIGDLETAKTIYTQGLETAQAQALPREEAALFLSLGLLAQRQQQFEEALELCRKSGTMAPDPLQRAQAQVAEFSLLLDTKAYKDADALALTLMPQLEVLPASRASLYAQANFAQRLVQSQRPGAIEQAATLLGKTVQQAKALGDRYAEAYALGYLGHAYEVAQQWTNAATLTEDALLVAQSLNATDIAYQWQWQLGRILHAQNKPMAAIAAYKTALQSLQSLRYDLASIAPDQQFSFRESVEPIYRNYVNLLLAPGLAPEVNESDPERLQEARQVIESLQIAELNDFFRAACLDGQTVVLDEVDQRNAAVIYPIILSDRLEVVVSLPNQPLQHHTVAIPRSQVESTLDALRRNLVRPLVTPDGRALGEAVYSWLIRPIETSLQDNEVSTLVFVLDGALRSVPMAALFNGDRYLIEDYSVALTPGLQLIDPMPLRQQDLKTLAGGLSEARHGFPPLEHVSLELGKVGETVPSQVLINQAFTSEAFRQQVEALPYPVVHLATHGQFSSRAEDTFILAWDQPLDVNEISAILRSGDVTRKAPIELLILSACETATGDDRAALGLAGIAVRAGVRSTIASLWSLDDESGGKLVGHLYDELVKADISKAEALRRAQLALLKDPDYRAPAFWSAFVLVGNWL